MDAIALAGDAITVGRTRDGGAFSITLLRGDGPEKTWAHSQPELDAVFEEIAAYYMPVRPLTSSES